MRNNIGKTIIGFTFILIMLFLSTANADVISLHVDDQEYTVSIPDTYVVYTPELGKDSSYVQFSGYQETEILDNYLKELGSCLVAVEKTIHHQLWLSIKDRSVGLGNNPQADTIQAYYDGVALGRGRYTVEKYNEKDYYLFAEGESIYKAQGGINYYISTFIGCYEVSVRWESGDGQRTDEEISLLKDIIHSVQLVN